MPLPVMLAVLFSPGVITTAAVVWLCDLLLPFNGAGVPADTNFFTGSVETFGFGFLTRSSENRSSSSASVILGAIRGEGLSISPPSTKLDELVSALGAGSTSDFEFACTIGLLV